MPLREESRQKAPSGAFLFLGPDNSPVRLTSSLSHLAQRPRVSNIRMALPIGQHFFGMTLLSKTVQN